MSKKRIIRKVLIAAAWLVVGSGMFTLLIAANNTQHTRKCKKVVIALNGGEKFYIDKGDIQKLLATKMSGTIINKPLTDFNLSLLEKTLEKHAWIKNAELFFDNQDVLHVLVTEKEPVLRVFTKNNATFYLDSAGMQMPLLDKISIRLPVVTNFPDYKKPSAKDSALIGGLKNLIGFINANEFWKAQIAQIDVADDYGFELIPTVGNHIIRFGKGENVEDKFKRLFVFYQQVMTKTGFDKYRIVDVQYADQIVGVKKEAVAKVDSIQLQKNIELLMNEAKPQEAEQQQPEVLNTPVNGYGPQEELNNQPVALPLKTDSVKTNPITPKKEPVKKDPVPVKAKPAQPHVVKQIAVSNPKKTVVKAAPKAVMPKRNEY